MTAPARRRPRDHGSVLPLVLVLTVALAAVVVGIAKYATASLRYSRVAEDGAYRLSVADAALRNGVDRLAVSAPDCVSTTPVPLSDSEIQLNGATASVECRVVSGAVPDLQAWALVATGEGVAPNSLLTTGGSGAKIVRGRMWLSSIDAAAFAGVASGGIELTDAPLVYPAATCPASETEIVAHVTFSSPVYGPSCVTEAWTRQPSFDDPPLSSSLASLPLNPAWTDLPDSSGDCRVFEPGRYTVMPVIDRDAYFRPGDYYFDPPSTPIASAALEIHGSDVVAGTADPGYDFASESIPDPPTTMDAACAAAIDADQLAGGTYGATFYMGSNAHIHVDTDGTLQIMPRLKEGRDRLASGATVDRSLYVGVQAICAPPGGPDGWCDSTDEDRNPVALDPSTLPGFVNSGASRSIIGTDSNGWLVVRGAVYVPQQQVRVTGTSRIWMLGGVIASRVAMEVDRSNLSIASGTATAISLDPEQIVLTATATLGVATTRMQALVDYIPAGNQATVLSWRVCDPAGC